MGPTTLVRLAARSLGRNRRRAALTAGSVLVGVTAIVVLRGVAEGYVRAVEGMVVGSTVGALQVHRQGFEEGREGPLQLDLPHTAAFVARLEAVPGVTAATPRIQFDGMLSNGLTTTLVVAVAIDPAGEARVCPGRFSPDKATAALAPGDRERALVGRALAEALGAGPGGTLTLRATTHAGAENAMDLVVHGHLGTVNPFESKRFVVLTLPFGQALTGMEGRVNEYALAVDDLDRVEEVRHRVAAAVGPGYEVVTWRERLPVFKNIGAWIRTILGFVAAVLLLLVLSGIMNTMLMSVYERVREIGTLLALGARRRAVVRLFLAESALLGLAGGLAGAGLGAGLTLLLGGVGLHLTPPGSNAQLHIHPVVDVGFGALAVAVAVAGAVVAALYPAYRAARLTPVEALRAL